MMPDASGATIPDFPSSTSLTAESYAQIVREASLTDRPTAELSYLTLTCWYGSEDIRVTRCGSYLLLLLAQPHRHVIVVGGADRPDPAAAAILCELGASHTIAYVPQGTALRMALNDGLRLVLDRDNADYIFDPTRLALLEGSALKGKRKLANRFERNYEVKVHISNLASSEAHDLVATMFDRWLDAKRGSPHLPALQAERAGIALWPRTGDAADRSMVCALLCDGEPLGVSVLEPMWAGTWMGVVLKTDPDAPGATAFLRRRVAAEVIRAGSPDGKPLRLNVQQDSGVAGLRDAKTSYGPLRMEVKYALSGSDRASAC